MYLVFLYSFGMKSYGFSAKTNVIDGQLWLHVKKCICSPNHIYDDNIHKLLVVVKLMKLKFIVLSM